jgi:hypothetical protein
MALAIWFMTITFIRGIGLRQLVAEREGERGVYQILRGRGLKSKGIGGRDGGVDSVCGTDDGLVSCVLHCCACGS